MKRVAGLFILFIVFACDDNDSKGCIGKVLRENEMIPYKGQELGCRSHLALYKLGNEQYFLMNNHCVDALFLPFDCNGNSICLDPESEACANFEQAEYKGIIGISKK